MDHPASRSVTTGPWLALVTALAVVVGIVALVSALLVRPGASDPQDAIARIPVSTATPYPYATTATPWNTGASAAKNPGPHSTIQAQATIGSGPVPPTTTRAKAPTASNPPATPAAPQRSSSP
ncbi:MAG: hypothetical protein ABI112_02095 [Terracoccus sp.]